MAGKGRKKNARRTPQPSGPSLSVCLIVKDAEDRIEKWVSSARRLADDIVVVDTGSNDETRKRAADAGARVFDFEWRDDFSAARNHGLAQASGDWVFILDADEVLARRDRKPLLKALRRSGVDAYRLPTRNYTHRTHAAGWRACSRDYPDEEAEAPGWFPTYKVRLFRRKPEHRFQGRVHEMAEDSILASDGRIADLPVPIHHDGTLGEQDPEKARFHLRLGELKVRDDPGNPRSWFELGVQAFALDAFERAGEAFAETLDRLKEAGPDSFRIAGHRVEMVHIMLGAVRERLGDPEGAEREYRSAQSINPEASEPHLNLGLLLERAGRMDEARGLIRRAADILPDNPQVMEAFRRVVEMGGVSQDRPTPRIKPQSAGPPPTLSLCMIVRDGAATLARAMESVRAVVDEVVVVDTGSTDASPDIARAAGAKVARVPWSDDFASARNAAIDRASGDWVLILDADEAVAHRDLETLRQALVRGHADGYRLMTRNYTDQPHGSEYVPCAGEHPDFERGASGEAYPGWFPSHKVRLFRRREAYRFRGRIHEGVDEAILEAGGVIADLGVSVHHHGVLDPGARREKGLRYLRMGEAKAAETPEDPRAWYELGVQAYEIDELDRAKDAFSRVLDLCRDVPPDGFRLDMAHVMLGAVAQRHGDPAGARRHYRRALEINPGAYEAHLNLGMVLEEEGDPASALGHFERVLAIRPADLIAREGVVRLGGAVPERPAESPPVCVETPRSVTGPDDGRTRVSLCMIVRDEAKNLPRCVRGVEALVSEVVVVDTGSTDGTPEIAGALGARVVEIPWEDDFASARNKAIDQASGDWVLVLDADEAIAPQDLETLRRALQRSDVAGYRMPSRNYTDQVHGSGFTPCSGEYPAHETDPAGAKIPGWYPTYKVRLFRRTPEIRFRGRVHEMVDEGLMESGGRIADLAVPVHHYGVFDPGLRAKKGQRYLRLGEAKVREEPGDARAWFELGVQAFETGDLDRSREAFERTLAVLRRGPRKAAERFQALGFRPDLAHMMLGVIAERKGEPAAAAAAYQAALKMNPRSHEAHMNWGVLLESRGDLKEARNHFRRATEILPRDPRAREFLDRVRVRIPRTARGGGGEIKSAARRVSDDLPLLDCQRRSGEPRPVSEERRGVGLGDDCRGHRLLGRNPG